MTLLTLKLSLFALILILIVSGLRKVYMQFSCISRLVAVIDLHPIARQIDCRVNRRFERESNVAKVLLGQSKCCDFAASFEYFLYCFLGYVLGKSTNKASSTAQRSKSDRFCVISFNCYQNASSDLSLVVGAG